MYSIKDVDQGHTRMELLPISAPVYGGGLIVTFLPEDYVLPNEIRAFLVFQGSRQRQITEAKISLEDNAFHAIIPDHEPPEDVALSAYIQFPNNECRCIATEEFAYFLDQTCYLARYLADSVHNLDSLEDWDNIQGPNFSLEHEDFSSLDERLTSAFQHLILPSDWSLSGDPGTEHIPRETLFHFASRLGLSTFVSLLLEKNGADQCLQLKNRHNELAKDIARDRGFDGLAELITDPHAHGVIRWESKEEFGQSVILKRPNFGTVSTTHEPYNNIWPPLENEIEVLSKKSLRPATPIMNNSEMWEDVLDNSSAPPSGRSDELYYDVDYESEQHAPSGGMYYTQYNDKSHAPSSRGHSGRSSAKDESSLFLTDNLQHLQDINNKIHYIRHQDIERLKETEVDETARLSTSCPDLGQDASQYSDDTLGYESPSTPALSRNRRALPLGINEEQLEAQILAADITQRCPAERTANDEYRHRNYVADGNEAGREVYDSDEPSPTSLQRRHSWHSSESLPGADGTSPNQKRRFSFQDLADGDTAEEEVPQPQTTVVSPTVVRRAGHQNMAMFTVVSSSPLIRQGDDEIDTDVDTDSRRTTSLSINNNNNMTLDHLNDQDRRFTISEGVAPGPSNFGEKQRPRLPPPLLPKPPVPLRPEVGPAKKLVTRKLSFLGKMRNSARNKPKEKGKVKTWAELKFGAKLEEEDGEDTFEGSDAVRDQLKKIKRPSVIHRPQSMMLNRPAQYPVGNPPGSGYQSVSSSSSRSNMRPTSMLGTGQLYPPSYQETVSNQGIVKSNRSSYNENEDATSLLSMNSGRDYTGSIESLVDEAAPLDTTEIENDPDLSLRNDEPETWSLTVDKKVLKKMEKKDIKRQENIFEFIQTERNYLTTLKIMQKIYAHGMLHEAHINPRLIDQIFPLIDEHVDYVSKFVRRLTERQSENKVVNAIGDLLLAQWKNGNGDTMKRLLGDFCSKQNEIITAYKDLLKNDKKFQAFMRKCDKNPLIRRKDVPGCALLVTQRITKYPIMLQTLVENSIKKNHKEDHANLELALDLSRKIAKNVDDQVQARERQQLLKDIYEKTESKTTTAYKEGRKFDRHDLKRRNRKLLYSSNTVQWNIKDSKKYTEVLLMLLTDCIVFLQENNGKYAFPSGQPAVVPLQKLIVREVANDEKGLYLISMSSEQMYKLKIATVDECKTLTNTIRMAVGNCPNEDEGVSSEDEEEKRIQERRFENAKNLIGQLELKDERINRLLTEKMTLFLALAESVGRGNAVVNIPSQIPFYSTTDSDESGNNNKSSLPLGKPILQKAIEQISKLSRSFYRPSGLSRHPSSVSENESSSRSTPSLPKRSDTFGGFDNDKDPESPRNKWLNSSHSEGKLSELEMNHSSSESSNRDSGLIDPELLARQTDSESSIPKAWEPINDDRSLNVPDEVDNAQVFLHPTAEQVAAITALSHLLSEYLSVASQQDTRIERLHWQFSQERQIGKKRGGNLEEAELKRNQIKQQEQIDDLRKQQQQLKTEREQWRREKERYQKSFDNEQHEINMTKAKLLSEKEEYEKMKEEVLKSKEYYQHEVKRLKEMQRKAQHSDIHSSSSTASLPTSTNRNNSNNSLNEFLDPTDAKFSLPSSKSQSSLHPSEISRRQSSSSSPTYTASEYPRTFPGSKRDSVIPSGAANAHQVPLHLQYSATNQIAAHQVPKHQDMNPKLSKLASSSKPQTKSGGGDRGGGVHQLIPNKLSKLGHLASNQHHGSSSKRLHNV